MGDLRPGAMGRRECPDEEAPPRPQPVREGWERVRRMLQLQSERDHLQRRIEANACELKVAEQGVGEWVCPESIEPKEDEKVSIWYGDALLEVTPQGFEIDATVSGNKRRKYTIGWRNGKKPTDI